MKKKLEERILNICRQIEHHWREIHADEFECFFAGGAPSGPEINDIDLFPINGKKIPDPLKALNYGYSHRGGVKQKSSGYSRTYKTSPFPIQIIDHPVFEDISTLQYLFEKFDFTHLQVGAHLLFDGDEIKIEEVDYTNAFVEAKVTNSTQYISDSPFPLSSLLRIGKYRDRGLFPKPHYYNAEVAKILVDLLPCLAKYKQKLTETAKKELENNIWGPYELSDEEVNFYNEILGEDWQEALSQNITEIMDYEEGKC